MEAKIESQFCPICKRDVKPDPRYPNYLCRECSDQAISTDGRPIVFSNFDIRNNNSRGISYAGYRAFYSDTKERYDSHICFVNGIKCRADEAYFGGIVVQKEFLTKADKIAGGLIGMLVGDALGVPYEFHERYSIPPIDQIEFKPPLNFRRTHPDIPIGTYSDDGAQALILLNTLLECGKFDAKHFAKGLVSWYQVGTFAVDSRMFDCGNQTAKAITKLTNGTEPLLAGGRDEYSNGNGSLMRVLPLALWHRGTDLELIADAFYQSAVTHGHIRSQICCAIYCLWARNLLNDIEDPWESGIRTFYKYFQETSIEIAELEKNILPKDLSYEIKGSGYVVDSFRAANWLNSEFTSFEDVLKRAVSLGNDTDTTACIAGGIAGLIYGVDGIPNRWRENLRGKEIFKPLLWELVAHVNSNK